MLRLEGLDPEGVVPYPHEPALRHLAEGRVDVSPGFTLATPWEGCKLGLDLVSLRPSAYGVDFYGDTLVTHQNLIDNNPELVQRFVAASMKGWAYALENSDEIADRISAELPRVFPVGDTVGFNRFQAEEVKRLMLYPLVVPGHTNPNRWRRMHEFLKASGAVTGDFDAQALIYDPQARHHERDLFLRNVLTIGLGSLLVVALIVLLLNWGLRRTVARRTHDLQKSEAALANAQRVAHFGSWERDLRTGVTTWSDEIYRMFGYKPGTIDPGRERAFRHLHPDDLARATAALDDAVEAGVGYDMEYRIVRPDGEERIIHSRGETILDDAGRTTQLRGAMHDITERKQADTEIRLLNEELEQRVVERTAELRSAQDELVKQERLAALGQLTATVAHELRNPLATIRASHYAIQREISRTDSKDGIVTADSAGTIATVNRAAVRMFGYRPDEIVGRTFDLLMPADAAQPGNAIAGPRPGGDVDLRARRKDGSRFPIDLAVSEVDSVKGRVSVAVIRDVTHKQEAENRLIHMANHDALTGLPNRALLLDRLQRLGARAKRSKIPFGVLFLDLDRFKIVNDSVGHAVGDAVLKIVAARLGECVRDDDTVARLGGDEFVVALAEVASPDRAANVAERIRRAIEEPMLMDGREVFISTSTGISLYPRDGTEVETLLKNADSAMYQAKVTGSGTYRFYTDEMNAEAMQRLALDAGLHRAVVLGEMRLHYQPQIDAGTGRLLGAEALLRWTNGELGNVGPDQFIPIAEENGSIVPIGEWVLRTACQAARGWLGGDPGSFRINVNLSAAQFTAGNLIEVVAGALQASGLPPEALELELTESAILLDRKKTVAALRHLKAMGVRIALDDFGTGYSTLEYLREFPVDTLKIDRIFAADVTADPTAAALTAAIIAMGHALGLRVVAEGVETEAQLAFFREQGCDEIQGFLVSRPLPESEFQQQLTRNTFFETEQTLGA